MSEPQIPPAPSRISTSPGPTAGSASESMRRSSFAWIRHVNMIDCSFECPEQDTAHLGCVSVFRVPAPAEPLVRAIQMTLHCAARARDVVLGDRVHDSPMLGDRPHPLVRAVVMMLESCE